LRKSGNPFDDRFTSLRDVSIYKKKDTGTVLLELAQSLGVGILATYVADQSLPALISAFKNNRTEGIEAKKMVDDDSVRTLFPMEI